MTGRGAADSTEGLDARSSPTEHVPVRFRFVTANGSLETETMWVVKRHDGYALDSIPWRFRGLALGDIIAVRQDFDGRLRFSRLVRAGGHCTIWLRFAHAADMADTRQKLEALGCSTEASDTPGLISVDVPPNVVAYARAKTLLDDGATGKTFTYEVACLRWQDPSRPSQTGIANQVASETNVEL